MAKPVRSWSSVVQGAVLHGMAVGARLPPKIAMCPRRYGLCLNRRQATSRYNGVWNVYPAEWNEPQEDQLIWVVPSRDVIFPDVEFKKTLKLSFSTEQLTSDSIITFVADGGDKVPSRLEELTSSSELRLYGRYRLSSCLSCHRQQHLRRLHGQAGWTPSAKLRQAVPNQRSPSLHDLDRCGDARERYSTA